ncbi:MAG TPA: thermonuclease family protein [Dehalococcoidia bacterium]|nr:thermonuclease family protein [Dehalococcoidia bacterium]
MPFRLLIRAASLVLLLAACTDGTVTSTPSATFSGPASATPSSEPTTTFRPNLTPATVTRVVDGDTIVVEISGREYKLRYIGINTPEVVDPRRPVECFGQEARGYNEELVLGRTVGLEKDVSETDEFGRLLRYVWIGDQMVNAALVREGYAQASAYPPDVKYQDLLSSLQSEAAGVGRGLWGTVCQSTPSFTPIAAGPGSCEYSATSEPRIKGNISLSTGEKIYHVPGGETYDKTVISQDKGERWFCTEAEALAAGWRKSKN